MQPVTMPGTMPVPPSYPLPALAYWRIKRAHSQDSLAEVAKVGRATIARIEGGAGARIGTLRRLAKALEVDPDALRSASDAAN